MISFLKRSPNLVAAAVVALITGIAHCVLLVADGVFWDDWIYVKALSENRMDIVDLKFAESAVFNAPYFYRFLRHLPGPVFGSKLLALAFLITIALCTYWLARSSKRLTNPESVLLAIITGTFPAYQTAPLLVTAIYLLSATGWYVGTVMLRASQLSPRLRIPLRIAGLLVFFFIAYPTNSFLVMNYITLLVLFVMEKDTGRPRIKDAPRFVLRNLDVALLPFAFWVFKERFFPRFGDYEDYNRIRPSPVALVRHSIEFLGTSIFANVNLALHQLMDRPALVLAAVAIVFFLWFRKERTAALSAETGWTSAHLAIFGLIVLFAAIFPYAVVDKGPHLHGKASRHALLIGLPVGILCVAALRRFARGEGDAIRPAGLFIAAVAVFGFALCDIDNAIQWEARWVKDRAIAKTLSKMPEAKEYSVFWVTDPTIQPEYDHYSYHDWSNIFRMAWGGQSHIGLDLMNSPATQLKDPMTKSDHYNLKDLDPNGPQANLVIRMNTLPEGNTDLDLVTHYIGYKLTRSPKLDWYLGRIVSVEITPADGPPESPF
jgi:hypothetical protein